MNKIKEIIIKFDNLTHEEQIKLWFNLLDFANESLSPYTDLIVFIKPNGKKGYKLKEEIKKLRNLNKKILRKLKTNLKNVKNSKI